MPPLRHPAWWYTGGSLKKRPILSALAPYVRRLDALGYAVDQIARILGIRAGRRGGVPGTHQAREDAAWLAPVASESRPASTQPLVSGSNVEPPPPIARPGWSLPLAMTMPVASRSPRRRPSSCSTRSTTAVIEAVPPVPWEGPPSPHATARHKLTELEVGEIRQRHLAGWSVYELAAGYEVSRNTIYAALPCPADRQTEPRQVHAAYPAYSAPVRLH